MDATESAKMLVGWDIYGPWTKFFVVAAPVLFGLTFIASITAAFLTAADQKTEADRANAAFEERLNQRFNKLESLLQTHNAIAVGTTVNPESLPPGWAKKVTTGTTATVEATTQETLDFGPVEMKTVGVLNEAGTVDVLFRTIAIVQSNRWQSNTCLLEGEKAEKGDALEAIFRTGHFAERLEFADDVLAVGIASRQSTTRRETLMTLTQQRAQRLSSALLTANVIHHPQALYDLPLGGSKDEFNVQAPDEADYRTVLVIGVKKASTDISIYSIIDEVVARGEFRGIGLSYFREAALAKNLLQPSVIGAKPDCARGKQN